VSAAIWIVGATGSAAVTWSGHIAAAAGITERTAQAVVADLEAAGYLSRTRTGRRVRYTGNRDSLFRHPAQEGHRVDPFLALLATARDDTTTPPGPDDR
jgi:DNA-binding transcriptional regulator PaaX